MRNVITFRIGRVSRAQAMNWLANSCLSFPSLTEESPATPDMFHGWRFVLGSDGVVYFANCIERGITQVELTSFKEVAA